MKAAPHAPVRPSAVAGTMTGSPLPGIAMLCTALVIFPGMDALAKILSKDLSPFQIALLRFSIQTALLAAIITAMRRPLIGRLPAAVVGRLAVCGLLLGAGTALFFWGLVYMPLANTLAIFFVQPLVVTVLAAVLLGERIGAHRLGAVAVGFVGTLIVIRPNFALFGWAAVLPALAAVAQSLQLIIVRSTRTHIDGLRMQFLSGGFAGLALAVGVAVATGAGVRLAEWRPIGTELYGMVFAVGALATLCQFLVVRAVRITPPTVLAPFQYLEIFTAVALGWAVFGDFPDALTLTGTAIILCAGFYVLQRERRALRRPAPADPAEVSADPGTA